MSEACNEAGEPARTIALFLDLYGNRWDLIEPVGRGRVG